MRRALVGGLLVSLSGAASCGGRSSHVEVSDGGSGSAPDRQTGGGGQSGLGGTTPGQAGGESTFAGMGTAARSGGGADCQVQYQSYFEFRRQLFQGYSYACQGAVDCAVLRENNECVGFCLWVAPRQFVEEMTAALDAYAAATCHACPTATAAMSCVPLPTFNFCYNGQCGVGP